MSQAQPLGLLPNTQTDVRAAIAHASQATGVDFNYLLAQAKIESSLNPAARARTSSAAGLYQFTKGTWLSTLDRHGSRHGLNWADEAISGGRVSDSTKHAQIMAMRFNPQASALMAAELANDNRKVLVGVLGREPDAAELYMAHFLGSEGASRFLNGLQNDPGQSAASLLPKAAAANRGIFFEGSGAPRSVEGVMSLMRGKVARAMEGGDLYAAYGPGVGGLPMPMPEAAPLTGGPIQQQFQQASAAQQSAAGANGGAPQSGGGRPSMAETLRTAFDVGGAKGAGAPDFVRQAYGKLQAFGL